MSDRLDIRRSDVFGNVKGRFDLIVCNSPYLKQVSDHITPREAYTDGADGLTMIRKVVKGASKYLRKNGALLFEYAGSLRDEVWTGATALQNQDGRQFGAVFGVS